MCVVTSHFCNRRGWKACHGSERKISAQATPEQRMPYLLLKVWPLLSHLWLPKSMPNVCCLLPKMIFYKDFNTVTGTWQMISLASLACYYEYFYWRTKRIDFKLVSKTHDFEIPVFLWSCWFNVSHLTCGNINTGVMWHLLSESLTTTKAQYFVVLSCTHLSTVPNWLSYCNIFILPMKFPPQQFLHYKM